MKKIIDFSRFSSIKIGPKVWVEIIEKPLKKYDDLFIVGGASNLLISEEHPPLAKLSKSFDYIKLHKNELKIGGATPAGKVAAFCKRADLGGLEFLSGLPGTIGGAVKMNAGLKEYEISNRLKYVVTSEGIVEAAELNLKYRTSDFSGIVYEAVFEVEKGFDPKTLKKVSDMRKNQPKEPSAGSVFKNPPGDYAGRLIEAAGLKGYRIGDMAFSEIHANFMVNLGKGRFKEAIELIETAKYEVRSKFSIELQEEIIIV